VATTFYPAVPNMIRGNFRSVAGQSINQCRNRQLRKKYRSTVGGHPDCRLALHANIWPHSFSRILYAGQKSLKMHSVSVKNT